MYPTRTSIVPSVTRYLKIISIYNHNNLWPLNLSYDLTTVSFFLNMRLVRNILYFVYQNKTKQMCEDMPTKLTLSRFKRNARQSNVVNYEWNVFPQAGLNGSARGRTVMMSHPLGA